MDIGGIINFLKLSTKFMVLICIISGILLFANQEFLEQLSLFDFKEEFKIYVGITFLFTLGVSIVNVLSSLYKLINIYIVRKKELAEKKIAEEKIEKQRIAEEKQRIAEENELYQRNLEKLDYKELAVIREFILQKLNNIEMSIGDSAVISLEKKGIIERISEQGYRGTITGVIYYFRIHIRAENYFKSYNFENINNIDRPEWIYKINQQKKIINQQNEFLETQNMMNEELAQMVKNYFSIK